MMGFSIVFLGVGLSYGKTISMQKFFEEKFLSAELSIFVMFNYPLK